MWKGSNHLKSLAISFTSRCNLSCSYCYLYSKQDIDKEEVPTDELIDVVTKTLKLFPSIDTVELWGGESTYNPERLLQFCKAMYALGVTTWIPSTNGTLIDKYEVYDAWRYCNQKYTSQISFDGNPKYHNKYRSNSFDKVVSNLKFAIGKSVPVSLRTTYGFDDFIDAITENFHWYPKIYKELSGDESLNPEIVDRTFAIHEYYGRKFMMIYQEIDTIFTDEEIDKKANIYRDYYKKIQDLVAMHWHDDIIFLPPYINDTVKALIGDGKKEAKNCGSFFSQIYLHTSSGDIYPCLSQDTNSYREIAKLANVYTGEVNWPVVNTVRSFMYRRNRACSNCFMQSSCFGACYHRLCEADEEGSPFNLFWNTAHISKCKFAHNIFDLAVKTSQDLLEHIN